MFQHMLVILAASGVFSPDRPEILQAKAEVKPMAATVGDLSGYYTCKGVEAGGKTYSGVAVIAKKNDVYVIQWMIGAGSTFTGIGVRQGENFSAGWAITSERGLVRGVNQYRVEPGPRLVGRWATLPGPGYVQNETLTFLKGLDDEE